MDNEIYRTTPPQAGLWKRLRQVLTGVAISALLLFTLAGHVDWVWGWVYIVLWLLVMAGMLVIVEKHNPGHLASRAEKPKNSKGWDIALMRVYTFTGYTVLVVAALDAGRFEWGEVPLWLHLLGIGVSAGAFALNTWALSSNKFTKTHVAIQEDEQHHVVSSGPYAHIRHPMYSAGLLMWLGIPLVLGSLWALLPGGLSMLVMVVRTVLEDRTLKNNLPGYGEYARQVPYRLIPGVW
jgi:protein-S-isoprenylcysteine O-methyltransferase Ste14